jgi:2-polyprenyl-3-methyl-5-hydroxy-6-metoxy-1,4-benzoquinol methylase
MGSQALTIKLAVVEEHKCNAPKMTYDLNYYQSSALDPERLSPSIIVPIVMSLARPKSVVDVGCGIGYWLSEFQRLGVERVLGLDGVHVDAEWLVIPKSLFRAIDLAQPFHLEEQFDLAVCLEVAEHLPTASAHTLVKSLVKLAPAVLFSCAIPMQGGTQHVNEQWPEYWRQLFQKHAYVMLDLIRPEVWKNQKVKFWYRQNMFLFVAADLVATNPVVADATHQADDLLLIHSAILREMLGLRSTLKAIPRSLWQALIRRTGMSHRGKKTGSTT